MPGTAAKVRVSQRQWSVLLELSRSRTVAKGIVQRAMILVRGVQGLLNEQIAVMEEQSEYAYTEDHLDTVRRVVEPLADRFRRQATDEDSAARPAPATQHQTIAKSPRSQRHRGV